MRTTNFALILGGAALFTCVIYGTRPSSQQFKVDEPFTTGKHAEEQIERVEKRDSSVVKIDSSSFSETGLPATNIDINAHPSNTPNIRVNIGADIDVDSYSYANEGRRVNIGNDLDVYDIPLQPHTYIPRKNIGPDISVGAAGDDYSGVARRNVGVELSVETSPTSEDSDSAASRNIGSDINVN